MTGTGLGALASGAVSQVLAVDVGGTKLAAARVDEQGRILVSERVLTPGGDAEELFATLAALVDRVVGDEDLAGCGVGCGGPMSAGGALVSPLNIDGWRDFPLRDRLAAHTGLGTWVDNDAKALAIGEGWRGAAAGRSNFLAMVVSTGIGAGLVVDGRVLDGASGNAGHLGHVVVEPDGRPCRCGGRGCLEAEASGSAIGAVTGRPAIEASPAVVERTGTLVGRGLASAVHLLDVPLAVVAGSVALGYGEPFFAAAQAELSARAGLAFARDARVVPAGLGAEGPLVGAAGLAWLGLGARVGSLSGTGARASR